MEIKPIRSVEDYQEALSRVEALMDAEPDTPEMDELEVLSTLVESYEQKHYPIPVPDPIEYLKNVMEFIGVELKDLAEILNSRSKAEEILNKNSHLSLPQIRTISKSWKVPVEPLIQEYALKKE